MKTLQENLKMFYLGLDKSEPFLYKNKDLTTHALIIGMTGSGKTGLGITLLEEALIDNIPSIIIDPKGDMTNLALTFEDMSAKDFLPYIEPDEARTKGMSVDDLAEETAKIWRSGIENSYQSLDRVRLLKNSAEVRIYTPNSSTGLGVSLLSDFEAPNGLNDEELNSYIMSIASSILSLVGLKADDFSSPEMLLIQSIFVTNFKDGRGVSIADLINQIANPPFDKIGVFDINTFYPSDKRMALAMKINALIANPSFSQWLNGEKLDISKMLFDENGKAKCNIFTISHLNDAQRMFFVTLLLNEMISWMRRTQGTSSLRAVLYMDEIFGFFPPNSNPPSKQPMLTLLKQARAFGLGCVLSTQNPVDLDYKGLSNIGTWFIGRLQTAQDKERVISGLMGVGSENLEKSEIFNLISNLEKRSFLVKNINENELKVVSTRFALSYLKGPLSDEQIKNLMSDKKHQNSDKKPKIKTANKPLISPGISEIYSYGTTNELSAYLYAKANVRFSDKNLDHTKEISLCLSVDDMDDGWINASDMKITNITEKMSENSEFDEIPTTLSGSKNLNNFAKEFKEFLYRNAKLSLYTALGISSNPNESREEFYLRLGDKANEILEAKTAEFSQKFEKERARLEDKIKSAQIRLEKEQNQAKSQGINTAISVGSTILGAIFGRSSSTASKVATTARSAGRMLEAKKDADIAKDNLNSLLDDMDGLMARFDDEMRALKEQYDIKNIALETREISPKKSDIFGEKIWLLWKS